VISTDTTAAAATVTTTTYIDLISKPVHFNARGKNRRKFCDVSAQNKGTNIFGDRK